VLSLFINQEFPNQSVRMIEVLFYIFAGVAILAAASILIFRNVLYAACSLVVTFLCVAAIYVLMGAEFVAVTQIMIYVGGIIVLMIFGVMLTNKLTGEALVTAMHNKFFGFIAGAGVFTMLLFCIFKINEPLISKMPEQTNNINVLGIGLMSDYILPFEIAAILLLLALVGAATIASNKSIKKE